MILVFGILLGLSIGVCGCTLYFRVYSKHSLAVMNEVLRGNLKARIPVFKRDFLGRVYHRFNDVVEKMETLVSERAEFERAKTRWLQELTHDLFTPLASIEMSLRNLNESASALSASDRTELVQGALSEVQYLSSLVDDFLFLSLLEDQSYFARKEAVEVKSFLSTELSKYQVKATSHGKQLHFSLTMEASLKLFCNPRLLIRLIHNCCDNAVAYSNKFIHVHCVEDVASKELNLCFSNDGVPFTELQISNFGKDREAQKRKTSHGLGSVIIQRVVDSLGGTLEVKNTPIIDAQKVHPSVFVKIPLSNKRA